MPRGPLGFPRLTNIGPLVTDGGQTDYELGEVGMVADPEIFGGEVNRGDPVEIAQLPETGTQDTVDVQILGDSARGKGMITLTQEEVERGIDFI